MKVTLVVLSLAAAAFASDSKKSIDLLVAKSEPIPIEAKTTGIAFFDEYVKLLAKTPSPTAEEVIDGPMFVLIPSAQPGSYSQFYAEKGLKWVLSSGDPALKPVIDFVNSPVEKSAIVFRPISANDPALLKMPVAEAFVPSNFRVGDLFKIVMGSAQLPFVIVADKPTLDSLHLAAEPLAKLALDADKIDIVKV